MPKFKSDEDLINALKNGGRERKDAMIQIYFDSGLKRKVTNFLYHKTGNISELEDVITEAFIIFERNVRNNKFKGESSLNTYIFSIAKFFWVNKHRRKKLDFVSFEEEKMKVKEFQNPELIFINEELKQKLEGILLNLTEKCRKVITFWSLSYNNKEIAEEIDLGKGRSARNQKHQCLKKLKQFMAQNPELIPSEYE